MDALPGVGILDNDAEEVHNSESDLFSYGHIKLGIPSKTGRAISLLADHVFSPSLVLAEWIESGLIMVKDRSIVELGAGAGLPSFVSAASREPPAVVVVTDYPDPRLLANLVENVERNVHNCPIHIKSHSWGSSVLHLLNVLQAQNLDAGYDIVVLSDLLFLDGSHEDLLRSLNSLLGHHPNARAYLGSGRYAKEEVSDRFIRMAREAGIDFVEHELGSAWTGKSVVGGLTAEDLSLRKQNCRLWIGERMSVRA